MAKITFSPGLERPFDSVFPVPVIATRAPTSTDIRFPLGQVWVRRDTAQVYILAQLASGAASWTLASPGASDVDTLTGDAGGAISPAAGNITLAGGTNIASSGAGSTITFNLDAAITLATSVTSPIYTVGAATNMAINSAAGQDINIKMGDAAGVNKVSFRDSANAEVAAIDSNGGFSMGAITFTGLLTANASATILTAGTALNLGSDNSGDAVNLAVGTVARAVHIADSAAAHTVTIGSVTLAASTDLQYGTGHFTINGAATGNITIGAAATSGTISIGGTSQTGSTFTLAPSTSSLTVAIANANGAKTINIGGGVSGNTLSLCNGINTSAQIVNIAGGAAAADSTVNILTGNASAGTITLSMATGNRATAINLGTGTGGNTLNIASGINAAAQVTNIASGASGADQTVNILSGNASAGTQTLNLATGTGGKTVHIADSASENLVTIGSVTTASALTLQSGTGAMYIHSTDNISIYAENTGLILNCGTGPIFMGVSYDTAITIGGGVGASPITLDVGTGAFNLGSNATDHATTLGSVTGSSALTLRSGTGKITVTGTVKEIDAQYLFADGTDLVVTQSPILQSNATTGVAPTGATGDINIMQLQDGCLMEQYIIGAGQTIIAPRMTSNGLDIGLDDTISEGVEYNFGARNNAKHTYTIGTSAAFQARARFYVEDLSGCLPLMMGFRKVEANNQVMADYTDYAAIGINNTTSGVNATILTELNATGQVATNTTDAWGGDGAAQTVSVKVSAAGVVTFFVNDIAATVAPAFTFDNTDKVMFFIHFLNGGDLAGEVSLVNLKIGYQA